MDVPGCGMGGSLANLPALRELLVIAAARRDRTRVNFSSMTNTRGYVHPRRHHRWADAKHRT